MKETIQLGKLSLRTEHFVIEHNRLPSQQFQHYSHIQHKIFFKTDIAEHKTTGLFFYMKIKSSQKLQKKLLLRTIEQLDKGRAFDIDSLARTNIRNLASITKLLLT